MVFQETYKDEENNWLNPEEVFSKDGKNFLTIKEKKQVFLCLCKKTGKTHFYDGTHKTILKKKYLAEILNKGCYAFKLAGG